MTLSKLFKVLYILYLPFHADQDSLYLGVAISDHHCFYSHIVKKEFMINFLFKFQCFLFI